MSRIKFISIFLAFAFTTQASYSQQATPHEKSVNNAAFAEKSKEFVTLVGRRVIEIIKASQNDKTNTDDDFRTLLKTHFNLNNIGRFALGRHWKLATPEEQKEYLKLFESVVVKTYASQFTEYTNENLEVTGARSSAEHGVTVLSRVIRPGHPPLNVNWEISVSQDGAMKIEDLIVNGVSMRITQRSEYMAVIQKNQGKVAGLIKALREQIERLNSTSS